MGVARRVVVTGLGVVSPLGCSVNNFWSRLIAADCGLVKASDPCFAGLPSRVVGAVDSKLLQHVRGDQRTISRPAVFALDAAEQALTDANFFPAKLADTSNIGVLMGVGMIDLADVYSQWESFSKGGYSKMSPWFIPKVLPNHAAGVIALKHKVTGLIHSVSTACATGAHAIGDAFRLIRSGELDAILVGGVDSSINPMTVAGFSRMRALSTEFNDNPKRASCPFDSHRHGFVLSEGAAALLLEAESYALNRKVSKIYGEIIGYGYSSDAHHTSAPPEDGKGAFLAMKRAIVSANILPNEVDYICAHATSTPLGDAAEATAVSTLFGNEIPLVSSIKGAIGHLLGAAGAVESVTTVLAIHNQTIPGNTGLVEIDNNLPPAFSKKLIPHGRTVKFQAKSSKRIALKNSFGFFGANASLCFTEYR